jgi:DNA polymerase IIIc chi subunit
MLTLDDKIESLTAQITANKGNAAVVEALEDQRAQLLIKRYPAYRDHNIGNKPVLKTQRYTEFVDCPDAVETVKEAIDTNKVFALTQNKETSVFFICQDWAVIVRVYRGVGTTFRMSQPSTAEAREQYKQLLSNGYQKTDVDSVLPLIKKEYL